MARKPPALYGGAKPTAPTNDRERGEKSDWVVYPQTPAPFALQADGPAYTVYVNEPSN
jgi:hypothetical protein